MLKPVAMQRIVLLATKNAEPRLISTLHRMGVMEIKALEIPGLERGKPLEIYDAVSRELVRVRSLLSAFQGLGLPKQRVAVEKPAENFDALAEAGSMGIDAELKSLVDARAALLSGLAELERKRGEAESASSFSDIDFSKLETKNFTFALGTIGEKAFGGFRKDADEYLAGESEILSHPSRKGEMAVLVFYPRRENIEFLLSRHGFVRITLPEGFSTYAQGVEFLARQIAEAKKSIQESESRLEALCSLNIRKLLKLESGLSVLSERAAIAMKFASARKIVAVEGWVKKKDVQQLKGAVAKDFAGEAELMEKEGVEDAPIALDNPKSISQFQWLVEFYSLPAYYEFDPTIIMLFTVPIIYGMIVGDVGYGLISIVLSLLIIQKYKTGMLGNIAKIWLFSSFSAIVFGVVFDEWFGFSHLQLAQWLASWGLNLGITHAIYEGISRKERLDLVLGLTLLVGLFQLTLGYVLGIINTWNHDRKHAYAKMGWIAVLLGGATAISSLMFKMLPQDVGYVAGGVFGLGAAVVIYLEGLPGLFEIPGLAANTLSYARIAAAGVVGVILAEIINEMVLPHPNSIILLPIFIVLHLLNAGLAMFESIVQGARLNLVEFYSKFFQGGGRLFKPFAMEEENKE
ncbi:V-type ATPase 116kDa subunit family protein [uncultured archaeon]|nr:V-type ATPase 116kDa subunit family protein [uncultured archaeon]